MSYVSETDTLTHNELIHTSLGISGLVTLYIDCLSNNQAEGQKLFNVVLVKIHLNHVLVKIHSNQAYATSMHYGSSYF